MLAVAPKTWDPSVARPYSGGTNYAHQHPAIDWFARAIESGKNTLQGPYRQRERVTNLAEMASESRIICSAQRQFVQELALQNSIRA
jgi:hypothetical protein